MEKELYNLKICEYTGFDGVVYTRVPGGWTYECEKGVCFIPYNDEFNNQTEINAEIIDQTKINAEIIDQIKIAFHHQLEAKTGWGRNEVKQLLDNAIESAT